MRRQIPSVHFPNMFSHPPNIAIDKIGRLFFVVLGFGGLDILVVVVFVVVCTVVVVVALVVVVVVVVVGVVAVVVIASVVVTDFSTSAATSVVLISFLDANIAVATLRAGSATGAITVEEVWVLATVAGMERCTAVEVYVASAVPLVGGIFSVVPSTADLSASGAAATVLVEEPAADALASVAGRPAAAVVAAEPGDMVVGGGTVGIAGAVTVEFSSTALVVVEVEVFEVSAIIDAFVVSMTSVGSRVAGRPTWLVMGKLE